MSKPRSYQFFIDGSLGIRIPRKPEDRDPFEAGLKPVTDINPLYGASICPAPGCRNKVLASSAMSTRASTR